MLLTDEWTDLTDLMNEFLEASGSPAKSALRVNPLARSGPRVRKRKTSEDEEKVIICL